MKKLLLIPAICALLVSCDRDRSNSMADATDYSQQMQSRQGNGQMHYDSSDPSEQSDWQITATIKKNLMTDSSFSAKAKMVSVTTYDGVVTLTGTIATREESRRISQMVQSIQGVVRVDNQLMVSADPSDQSDQSDGQITATIKKNLMNDNSLSAKAKMVSVTTNDGVVTLTGTVATREESRRISQMVQSVQGVVRVDNQLMVSTN